MHNIKAFLGRGALAGIAGGVAAALFHWLVTERQIRQALAIEAARESGSHEEMFSRGTQVIGGMLGAGLYGVFLGLIFGFVCALLWVALTGRDVFTRSIRLAAIGFVAWTLVPALKYPANPPGVGNPDTIGQRTASFLALALVSLLVAVLAWELWKQLTEPTSMQQKWGWRRHVWLRGRRANRTWCRGRATTTRSRPASRAGSARSGWRGRRPGPGWSALRGRQT